MSSYSGPEVMYADGTWQRPGGEPVNVYNPATEEVLASVPSASAADVHRALEAARRAQRPWARTTPIERGKLLRGAADVIAAHADALAATIVSEVGKPLAQAKVEADFAVAFLRYSAEWDRRLEGEILPGDVAGEVIHLTRAPVGVVAAICPWNFPLAVMCRKLGPALITGNAVVVKPSEVSPLSTIQLFHLLDEHLDLPPGLVNLVPGGPETGRALVQDESTSMVSFTGHRDTGKSIMGVAAHRLTRVALELGGKAPAIVWRDADLDVAVPAIIAARHTNAGQVCTSAERVFVHRDVYQDFVDAYVAGVEALTLGDPLGPVDVGPLASAKQLGKTSAAVAGALAQGAKLLTGGSPPGPQAFAKGYWYRPTVLHEVTPAMDIMREETFGPVTPLLAIDALDEVLRLANDSRYGLSAYLFSRDYSTIMRTVEELDFGEIYVNRALGESVHAHHAGYKESGIGGEDGKWGLMRYTQIKTVYHHYGAAAD